MTMTQAMIEADERLPVIRVTRDFAATAAQLLAAHSDPERFVQHRDGQEYGFRGCFHEVGERRIVQTFSFEGEPDGVALETVTLEDLGGGRSRLRAQSLVDSFEARDAWLRMGMGTGVTEGYAKLDRVLSDGAG